MIMIRAWWPRFSNNNNNHHHINTSTSSRRKIMMMMMMEEKEDPKNNKKEYLHYNHTDNLPTRWTSRECYEFMYASRRPWHKVVHFYSLFLNSTHSSSLLTFPTLMPTTSHHHHSDADDFIEEPELSKTHLTFQTTKTTGRWARANFKIVLSYHGPSFDGWQKQPALNTVQGVVENSLGKFIDEKKFELLKHKGLPIEGCAVVAGRTDKGVTALQQVCSFYTWRDDVKPQDIEETINDAAPGKLRVISVSKVSRAFHPNFSAIWRRYLYIFPLNGSDEQISQSEDIEDVDYNVKYGGHKNDYDDSHIDAEDSNLPHGNSNVETRASRKPTSFSVNKVNQLLHQLEGKLLSYRIFARDTKASRSIGPPTECFVFHARAAETTLPSDAEDTEVTKVMCIELVANRFLRKMVRVLVATSIREAAAGADDDALIKLMDATCRRATAPPAPPDGLCLVDVGYSEFNTKICLIQ